MDLGFVRLSSSGCESPAISNVEWNKLAGNLHCSFVVGSPSIDFCLSFSSHVTSILSCGPTKGILEIIFSRPLWIVKGGIFGGVQ